MFSLVFGLIVEGVGEDVFASVLGRMGFFQPVVAALVGLVPNCAASVLMTHSFAIKSSFHSQIALIWQLMFKSSSCSCK